MAKNDILIILSYIPPVERAETAPKKAQTTTAMPIRTRMKRKLLKYMLEWCEMEKHEVRIMLSKTGINAMASVSGVCMVDSHPLVSVPAFLWFAISAYCLYRKFAAKP